jgi:copper(I)-binding protein
MTAARAVVLAALAAVILGSAVPTTGAPSGVTTEATPAATPLAVYGVETPGEFPISLIIRNDGDDADRLLGGTTPVAARVVPHHAHLVHGQREMTPLPEGIVIPPHTTLTLEPGADHLMLSGLRQTLIEGHTFPLTLHFARAGDVPVTVSVWRKIAVPGGTPIPPVTVGDLTVSFASVPPAPLGTIATLFGTPAGTPSAP